MFVIRLTDRFRGRTTAPLLFLAAMLVTVIPSAGWSYEGAVTDFSGDGKSDLEDLNMLLALGPLVEGYIVEPGAPDPFDLNSDGRVNIDDVAEWRAVAAKVNELGSPYKVGDANLNGVVDGQDFVLWNAGKFTWTLLWDGGDFNCDGVADGQDFLLWNANKFTSSDVASVPEPASGGLLIVGLLAVCRSRWT